MPGRIRLGFGPTASRLSIRSSRLARLNLDQVARDGSHGVGQRAADRGEAGDRGQRDQEADQGILDGAAALLVVQETAEEERHRLSPRTPAGVSSRSQRYGYKRPLQYVDCIKSIIAD